MVSRFTVLVVDDVGGFLAAAVFLTGSDSAVVAALRFLRGCLVTRIPPPRLVAGPASAGGVEDDEDDSREVRESLSDFSFSTLSRSLSLSLSRSRSRSRACCCSRSLRILGSIKLRRAGWSSGRLSRSNASREACTTLSRSSSEYGFQSQHRRSLKYLSASL